MTSLFDPITVGGLTVKNRIWLSPMCQYSVERQDGVPTDWHLVHLGARAVGGFGLLLTEATAVLAEGRISPQDTGLWNEAQVAAWRPITDFVHAQGALIGVQLAHAGRKSSTYAEWYGSGTVPATDGGWTPQGPSPLAFGDYSRPAELTVDEISDVVTAFADAADRAAAAGFDVVEIHAAHGYLLHEFLSPLANRRTDGYGGDFAGRTRLVLEVVDAIRARWTGPVLVRISATDWVENGWDVAQSVELGARLREHGVDLVDVSSGGLDPAQDITIGPGYQVPFARDVRIKSDIPTGAVGLITEPAQAQQILDEGSADVVLLARAALREPSWPVRAAFELDRPAPEDPLPRQYERAAYRRTR